MSSLIPSIPYSPASDGYWGPVTSTLDWCEENYYLTYYCAEVVNSFTNIMFAYLAYRGIRNCVQQKHDKVFLLCFLAYLMIGLGSFCFHATLSYEMQLVDEISMIYTHTILVYALFSHMKPFYAQVITGVLAASLAMLVSICYFYLGDPVFHQVAFIIITLLILGRGIYLMEFTLRPRWRKVIAAVQGRPERWTNGHGAVIRAKDEMSRQQERDRQDLRMLRDMYVLMGYGLCCALLGFSIWGIDRVACGSLRRWRNQLGLPWGILLEGHGWWHILTGIGGYCNIVWNIWMRYGLYGRQQEIEVVWPSLMFSMPEVIRKTDRKSQ